MSKRKKTGRPAGSKTEDRAIVVERPATCPVCGSPDRTKKETIRTMLHGGVKIIWSKVACNDCPAKYTIRNETPCPPRQAVANQDNTGK